MSMYLGDFNPGDTVRFMWSSNNSSGASITRATNGTISVYQNLNTTQTTTGVTDTEDFDTLTGIHAVAIDTSADATFYAAARDFVVVLSAATIDGQTVNAVLAHFSIRNRSGNVTHWLGTAAATPTVAGVPEVDVTHLVGVAQSATDLKDFADDGYDPSTNKVQGVVLTDTVTTYTGNTPQTGDAFARLGAPAGASVSADILAIDNFVDDLESRLGTPSNLGSGATIAANLVDIEGQTDDIGAAGAGLTAVPWNAAWDAEVQSEVDDALVAQNLDHLVKIAVDTDFPTTVHLNSVIGHLADNGTVATFDRTTDSLEALQAEHDATQTALNTVDDFLDTEVAAIKAVTDALPNAGALTTIQSDLDDIQTRIPAALVSGRIDASVGAMAANVMTAASAAADLTTELQSGLATAAALDIVDNFLDTEIADIQARLPAALTAGGNMKSDALAVNGSTSAAAQLARSAATIVNGAAIAGTLSTTQMTTDLTEATDDHYNGRIIIWTSGVLINQATDITDYTGATKLLTYTAITEAPTAGDTFIIV